MRWPRGALPAVLAVVFVDTLGYAIVVPLIPFALRAHGATPLATGIVFAAFSLCQLITAPILGRLSDRIGRRPVLALSQAGSAVGFGMLALSTAFPVVLLSRIIDGSSAGNLAICYAAVLDSDSEDERRRGIPALGAAAGAGIVVGLGLSALLAGVGFGAAALAAMMLSLGSLALTGLVVPETRRDQPALGVRDALRMSELRRGSVFVAACAALLAAFLLTLPPYLSGALHLSAQATTAVIASIVFVAAAFQAVVLPRMLAWLKVWETAWLLVVVCVAAAALVATLPGGSTAVVAVVAATLFLAMAAAGLAPVAALLLSESRPGTPMGLVMGLNTSSSTTGQIIGPIAGYAAFSAGGSRGLGLGCMVLGACAVLGLRRVVHD